MSELREGTHDLDSFWPTVMSICVQLERHYNTDDLSLAEQLILRAEECTSVLRAIYGRVCEVLPGSAILHDVLFVIGELQNYCQHYTEWTLRDERDHPRLPIQPDCPVQHSVCSPGRPSYVVQRADLEALLEAGFNFRQMGTILGVSERTIRRRRELFGLPIGDNFSDHDLDGIVAGILQVSSIVTVVDYVSSHFNVLALVCAN